jgi:HAD superfamily hydrolase (TIGR01509 family)
VLCLIFDLDGTLVDSEPLSSQAFLDLLPDLRDTTAGLMARYRGHRLADVFADIALRLGRPLPDGFEHNYRERVATLYDTHLVAMPGVIDMLMDLPNPRCVASNGPPSKVAHGLRAAGLEAFFSGNVFSSYEVGRWKPDPHLFLHAADRMGFTPTQCIVVEDSDAGLAAAQAAGMSAIRYCPTGEPVAPDSVPLLTHFRDLKIAIGNIARTA